MFNLPLFLSIFYTLKLSFMTWCSQSSTVTAQALDMGCRSGESTILCQDNSAYCPQCELQRETKCPLASGRAPQRHLSLPLPLSCPENKGQRFLFVMRAQKLSFKLPLLHIDMQKLGTIITFHALVSLFLMTVVTLSSTAHW